MTATAPRSNKLARKSSAPTKIHAVGELHSGRVIVILKDDTKPDAIPHAFLLKFADSIAYLPARNLKCAKADRSQVMKTTRLGDHYDLMITAVTGNQQNPKYEVNEAYASAFITARARIGETVAASVLTTESDRAIVKFDKRLTGTIDVNELGSKDQGKRLATFKRGHQLKAVIQNVTVDAQKPEVLHYELSELVADLNVAAEKVGERVRTTIVGYNDSGLNMVLKNGVAVHMTFGNFNGMPLDDLKIGGPLEVVVQGIIGRALSVTWQAK